MGVHCPESVSVSFTWLDIDTWSDKGGSDVTWVVCVGVTRINGSSWFFRLAKHQVDLLACCPPWRLTFAPIFDIELRCWSMALLSLHVCCSADLSASIPLTHAMLIGYFVIILTRRRMPIVCGRYHSVIMNVLCAKLGEMLHKFVERLMTSGVRP